MKQITILTGPQGSGNHLFAKIFELHPDVRGWEHINDSEYALHINEPYYTLWSEPDSIDDIDWEGDHHIMNISCPYGNKFGVAIPDYKGVIAQLQAKGFDVQIGIIGRDKNITALQQLRLRGKQTTHFFEDELPYLTSLPHTFLSFELAMLYKLDYVKSIAATMGIPVNLTSKHYDKIFSINANKAYVSQIKEGVYDEAVLAHRMKKMAAQNE